MLLEAMPAIDGNLVIPPVSELRSPTVLWLKFDGSNLFKWVLLLVPDDADAVCRDECIKIS